MTAIDAFGDLDQHRLVRASSLEGAFTARAAVRAARSVECDAVVYLANFENHPNAVKALAEGRALWGNPPEVIRRVRDPMVLAEVLRKRGFPAPQVRLKPDPTLDEDVQLKPGTTYVSDTNSKSYVGSGFSRTDSVDEWLVKPLASGGGQRIRRWRRGEALPRGCYLQELINGGPGSVVFVAAGGRAGTARHLAPARRR